MRNYIIGLEAAQGVAEIWEYIPDDNVDAADRQIETFFEAFDMLADRPQIGHKREDLTNLPLFFWSIGSYLIVYRAKSKTTEIVAIVHGSRDIPTFLRKRGRN